MMIDHHSLNDIWVCECCQNYSFTIQVIMSRSSFFSPRANIANLPYINVCINFIYTKQKNIDRCLSEQTEYHCILLNRLKQVSPYTISEEEK